MGASAMEKRPEVIITTALGRDDFINRAMMLGAQYYIVKPYKLDLLYNRIHDMMGLRMRVASAPTPILSPSVAPSLDERIASMFLTIGIPAHIKGYHFLREAVKMVLEDGSMINAITKALYPGIAKRHSTTASKVERAIRHAIDVAWTRGRIENFNQVFGYKVFSPGDKPTNGEFIALIADKLSMERSA
jgi:two-component system response regulator (stage 0 sporulation protein A)